MRGAGQKVWKKGMTLAGAVALAGGATPFGALNRVKLYRRGKVYAFDLRKKKDQMIKVYPQDIIEVPQKNFEPR